MISGKYQIFYDVNQAPIGYLAWGAVNYEALLRIRRTGLLPMYFYEWDEGDITLIIDIFLAPFSKKRPLSIFREFTSKGHPRIAFFRKQRALLYEKTQKIFMLNLSGRRKLPIVRQSEASECGLACIAMIAGYFGYDTDLASLRRQFTASLQGMTLGDLIALSDKLSLSSRPIQAPLGAIAQVELPAILHWDMSHFVVLKSVSLNKITVHDPALGVRTYSKQEFSNHYTGVALELKPASDFKKAKSKTDLRITELWGKMVGLKRNLVQLLLLSVILQLFVLASPLYLQSVVDEVLTKFNSDLLLVLALGFAGFTLINVVTHILRSYVILYFSSVISFQMVSNLHRHLIRLPMEYFEKRHIGDIVSRFGSLQPIKTLLTEGLISSIIDGLMALTTLILMFIYSPILALIALFAWVLYLVVRLVSYTPYRQAQEDLIVSEANENSTFLETVRGINSLKLFSAENLWQKKYADTINNNAKSTKYGIWYEGAHLIIFGLEHVILIYIAAKMILAGTFTVGMILAQFPKSMRK